MNDESREREIGLLADEVALDMESLVITEGSRRGERMDLLPWQHDFIYGLIESPVSALTVARGNGKTTLVAGIAVSALAGALAVPRGEIIIVASSYGQANKAFRHAKFFMRDKIEYERLPGRPRKYRWKVHDSMGQGMLIEDLHTGTRLMAIGSDPDRAHSLAPSLVLADEPAKWKSTRSEEMYIALITSMGKQQDSKFVALGTRSDDPGMWFSKLLEGERAGVTHVSAYFVDPKSIGASRGGEGGAPLEPGEKEKLAGWEFDDDVIRMANPSIDHMPDLYKAIRADIQRVKDGTMSIGAYRALRLNEGTPEVERRDPLISLENWKAVTVASREDLPPKHGPVAVGIDLGGGVSMSAAALYWPATGRLEVYAALPAEPGLLERGKNDGVADRYVVMHQRGELEIYPGPGANHSLFISDVSKKLAGEEILSITADHYKDRELNQALTLATDVSWGKINYRRTGAGPDGGRDIRAFQADVLEKHLTIAESLLVESALRYTMVTYHPRTSDPGIIKNSTKGRIDAIQASLLAVSEGRRWRLPEKKSKSYLELLLEETTTSKVGDPDTEEEDGNDDFIDDEDTFII